VNRRSKAVALIKRKLLLITRGRGSKSLKRNRGAYRTGPHLEKIFWPAPKFQVRPGIIPDFLKNQNLRLERNFDCFRNFRETPKNSNRKDKCSDPPKKENASHPAGTAQ